MNLGILLFDLAAATAVRKLNWKQTAAWKGSVREPFSCLSLDQKERGEGKRIKSISISLVAVYIFLIVPLLKQRFICWSRTL